MIALKSVISSDLSCYSVSGRSSALADHDSYVAKLLRHEKRNERRKSTESLFGKDANEASFINEIFATMVTHQDDAQVQDAACRALSRLLDNNNHIANRIGEDEGQLTLHNCVVAAMRIHIHDAYVFQAACSALHDMASASSRLQQFLVAKGTYLTIVDNMREQPNHAGIQEWGFRALRALCAENVLQEEVLIKYGLLPNIIKTIHIFAENVGVLEEALSLLACLAADMEIVRRQCLLELVHERIVEIIRSSLDSVPLLKICFEALTVVAASDEQPMLVGVLNVVEETMRKYKFIKDLQITGCILTQLLANCENNFVCANCVSLVAEAMINFPCDVDVQTEAAVAMNVLAELENGLIEIVNQDAYQHFFSIMDSKTLPADILQIAAGGLMIIGAQQTNKDRMLQWALTNGHMKEAKWLLGKGADINAATQEKLNTVIAAEAGNIKMMRFLLENGATHTQEALKVSQGREDHVMVGMLLRHIGLERKGDVLAWGSMNITQLKSEYFTSSLIGEQEECSEYSERADWSNHFETAAHRRLQRYSSLDRTGETAIPNSPSEEDSSFDENSFIIPDSTNVNVRRKRPRSVSGALLPFNNMDPRIEGPLEACEKFVRLDSPCLRNSYPGHPDSLLIPDPTCGSLLTSPVETKSFALPPPFIKRRALSALSTTLNSSSSSESSPLMPSRRKLAKQSSALDIHSKYKLDSKPLIQYADLSCNHISNFNVFSTRNPFVRPFFNGLLKLDLRGNDITEFPEVVCRELTSIKQLHLAENHLKEFPYEILNNKTLEILNLNKNSIEVLESSKMHTTMSLTTLDMNQNLLTKFPSWLGDYVPALTHLILPRNRISTLASRPLQMRQLKMLDLSRNKIEVVPPQFFDQCVMLEKLDLSNNCLISLPVQAAMTFNRLSHLKLAHNLLKERPPWYVPRFVLQLQNLTILDMEDNKVTQLPLPSMWASRCLRDLNFDNNRITKLNLDESASQWSILWRLSLAHNKLERLPPNIGHLTGLAYLNISHNTAVKTLPDEIGRLRNLLELPRDGLTLNLHPSISQGTAQEICTFLYSRMKNAVPYHRMKLMVVGKGERGKSSLLRALQGIKPPEFNTATIGIEVKTWNLTIPKKYLKDLPKISKDLPKISNKKSYCILSTWDFAGQEDFHCTHQCFMSSRALYLAVFDASKGPEELEFLRPWLLNINASAPGASVILVGTHADEIKSENRSGYLKMLGAEIDEFMRNPGFPTFRGLAIVSCIGKNNAIDALKERIVDTVAKFTFNEQVAMDEKVPKSYVQLEDLLADEANRLIKSDSIPVISRRALMKIVLDNNLQLENQELDQAVKFLHETGVLMHFDDPGLKLSDCYFIHPEWLSQMMAQVVTVPEVNPFVDQGVLDRQNLPMLFRGERFPEAFIDNYLRLLQKFEVVIPLNDEKVLIPSKLPAKPSGFTNRAKNNAIHTEGNLTRYYKFPYIPVGFWARLISRLMLFQSPLQNEAEKTPLVEYWRDGIFRFWSGEKYFVVTTSESNPDTIEIIVPVSQRGYELLGFLVDHVDTLVEEWYPGLHHKANLPIMRLAPCNYCLSLGQEHSFPLEQCIKRSYESDSIWCPSHEDEVSLRSLAPDVLLADIDGKFMIKEKELESMETKENVLGGGAFGTVYQTKYRGSKNVAVKVFKLGGSVVPHRYLRQEVTILLHLRHPSLVSMLGVCLRPHRSLVMELAQKGSLKKVLDSSQHLSRGMQHRIALQVAEGLAYLHSKNIVYRDMKPSNILIFSLSMGIPVNAKISDYGISQYITPQGFCEIGGTPGYRAPEVVRGDSMYNKEADIFSLGVTFYELVTQGKKPFGDSPYQCELDAATISKSTVKPLPSVGCPHWPDMQNIIVDCLQSLPDKRPPAESIFQWLSCADTLCLKQEVGVCKEQAVECMAVYKSSNLDKESLEVWIGSGDSSGQSQISWLPLIERGKKLQGCRGMILRDERILCMCVVTNDLILAGTQKGNVLVFDAKTQKQLNTIYDLGDSVLCLKVYSCDKIYFVIAGLANGEIAVFNGKQFRDPDVKPQSQLQILQNELAGPDIQHHYPVTCLEISRRKCYCGIGPNIAVMDPKRGHMERLLRDAGEPNKIISHIAIWKYIWVTSKDSSTVRCLDNINGNFLGSFDCAKILQERFPDTQQHDCRVLSIYHHSDALWIGCGGGHVILMEPNQSFKVFAVLSRHTSAVRCIVGASGHDNGKPVSLVLTGGIGFTERSHATAKEDSTFGYVLVWEAELPRQYASLENLRKSRQIIDESLEKQ